MNEIPRNELVDAYSTDEKWVKNEVFGYNSMLVYLLTWPVAFIIFLLFPVTALIYCLFNLGIVIWCCFSGVDRNFRKLILRTYVTTFLAFGYLSLLDQITFGEVDWLSKKAKAMAMKHHTCKRELYSLV